VVACRQRDVQRLLFGLAESEGLISTDMGPRFRSSCDVLPARESDAFPSSKTARVHHAARRRGGASPRGWSAGQRRGRRLPTPLEATALGAHALSVRYAARRTAGAVRCASRHDLATLWRVSTRHASRRASIFWGDQKNTDRADTLLV
jgi:hypothetical protein